LVERHQLVVGADHGVVLGQVGLARDQHGRFVVDRGAARAGDRDLAAALHVAVQAGRVVRADVGGGKGREDEELAAEASERIALRTERGLRGDAGLAKLLSEVSRQ
jgi:hypothetical protein